jgi:glutathione reductase (NADPH)
MTSFDYDLFVIGAGSGGVRAARIASGHGARVAVAEEHRVGGTCVIRGCVPKKLLVYGAHFAEDLEDARRFGWSVGESRFHWKELRDNVLADVDRLNGIYKQTLTTHKVDILHERAVITGPNEVEVGGRRVSARYILVATGARPHVPDFPGAELGITSNEAFHLEEVPGRVVIAGAGYIANEFAGIFHQFGAHVTLVNRTRTILRQYDHSLRERLLMISTVKGIDFRFDCEFDRIERHGNEGLLVHTSKGDPIPCDLVMFATGRVPNTEGLGLQAVGVETGDRGEIKVDADSRTNIPSIYAVGDVTNRVQLTPVAIKEGHAFADTVFGNNPWRVDYDCIPSAVFSHPPLAGVGMTESEARNMLGSVKVYSSDFRPMKNVLAGRDERAFYKLVVDAATDEVVGAHMIGPDAPEIMQALAIAVKSRLTKTQVDRTFAIHPTMAEELVLMK